MDENIDDDDYFYYYYDNPSDSSCDESEPNDEELPSETKTASKILQKDSLKRTLDDKETKSNPSESPKKKISRESSVQSLFESCSGKDSATQIKTSRRHENTESTSEEIAETFQQTNIETSLQNDMPEETVQSSSDEMTEQRSTDESAQVNFSYPQLQRLMEEIANISLPNNWLKPERKVQAEEVHIHPKKYFKQNYELNEKLKSSQQIYSIGIDYKYSVEEKKYVFVSTSKSEPTTTADLMRLAFQQKFKSHEDSSLRPQKVCPTPPFSENQQRETLHSSGSCPPNNFKDFSLNNENFDSNNNSESSLESNLPSTHRYVVFGGSPHDFANSNQKQSKITRSDKKAETQITAQEQTERSNSPREYLDATESTESNGQSRLESSESNGQNQAESTELSEENQTESIKSTSEPSFPQEVAFRIDCSLADIEKQLLLLYRYEDFFHEKLHNLDFVLVEIPEDVDIEIIPEDVRLAEEMSRIRDELAEICGQIIATVSQTVLEKLRKLRADMRAVTTYSIADMVQIMRIHAGTMERIRESFMELVNKYRIEVDVLYVSYCEKMVNSIREITEIVTKILDAISKIRLATCSRFFRF